MRARRYGANQIAARPSVIAIPNPPPSTRRGVPATRRIPASITTMAITVPRSGSARISRQKSPTRSPTGRTSSARVRGGFLRDR